MFFCLLLISIGFSLISLRIEVCSSPIIDDAERSHFIKIQSSCGFTFANFLTSATIQAIGQTFQNGWTISIKWPQRISIWKHSSCYYPFTILTCTLVKCKKVLHSPKLWISWCFLLHTAQHSGFSKVTYIFMVSNKAHVIFVCLQLNWSGMDIIWDWQAEKLNLRISSIVG